MTRSSLRLVRLRQRCEACAHLCRTATPSDDRRPHFPGDDRCEVIFQTSRFAPSDERFSRAPDATCSFVSAFAPRLVDSLASCHVSPEWIVSICCRHARSPCLPDTEMKAVAEAGPYAANQGLKDLGQPSSPHQVYRTSGEPWNPHSLTYTESQLPGGSGEPYAWHFRQTNDACARTIAPLPFFHPRAACLRQQCERSQATISPGTETSSYGYVSEMER